MQKEIRSLKAEYRLDQEENKPTKISGYAAVFDSPSQDLGGFVEIIKAGAFKNSLKTRDIFALYAHNPDSILGRKSSGTLSIKEDEKGLAIEIEIPDTTLGNDIRELITRGDLTGMSFGFQVIEDEWNQTNEGTVRTLKEVCLHEISVVPEPAYLQTVVDVRSFNEFKAKEKADELKETIVERKMVYIPFAKIEIAEAI